MKTITLAIIVTLGAGLAGFASQTKPEAAAAKSAASPASAAQTPAGTNAFSDDLSRNSYAVGMMFGSRLKQQEIDVDYTWVLRGLKDARAGGPALMTDQEIGATLNQLQKDSVAKQEIKRREVGEKNKKEGDAFLAQNKTKPGVITLPDGLQYKVITNGTGDTPVMGDIVTVNYVGTFIDGKEFDSTTRAGHPVQLPVGKVIPGWTEAMLKMKVGSKWQLFIPSELAYGERGRPGIDSNSVLIFETELVSIEHPRPATPVTGQAMPLTSDIIKVPSQEEMKKGAKIEVIKPEDAAKYQQSQTPPAK